jgi:hypothetical protein
MIITIIAFVVGVVGGFIGGILVGRKNPTGVNTILAATKTAGTTVVADVKKI